MTYFILGFIVGWIAHVIYAYKKYNKYITKGMKEEVKQMGFGGDKF